MSSKQCSLCHREVEGNVNAQKILVCGRCTQILLVASRENKAAYRDKLISEGHLEEARAIESFISVEPEKELINEPSRKFRPVVVRKRFSRKIRPTCGKRRPLQRGFLLDQKRVAMH